MPKSSTSLFISFPTFNSLEPWYPFLRHHKDGSRNKEASSFSSILGIWQESIIVISLTFLNTMHQHLSSLYLYQHVHISSLSSFTNSKGWDYRRMESTQWTLEMYNLIHINGKNGSIGHKIMTQHVDISSNADMVHPSMTSFVSRHDQTWCPWDYIRKNNMFSHNVIFINW